VGRHSQRFSKLVRMWESRHWERLLKEESWGSGASRIEVRERCEESVAPEDVLQSEIKQPPSSISPLSWNGGLRKERPKGGLARIV